MESNWAYICIVIISSITSILLILGVISFFLTKNKTVVYELVVYLSITCFLTLLSYMLPWGIKDGNSPICIAQSFLMVIFESSQFLWATIIGYNVSKGIKSYKGEKEVLTMKKRIIYYIIGFVIPIIFGILAYYLKQMGDSGMWCWIKNEDTSGIVFQWIDFCLAYASGIINLTFSIRVISFFNKDNTLNPEEKKIGKKLIYKLIRFPIIQLISILPATINRIVALAYKSKIDILFYISLFFECSQGLLIIITYWINEGMLEHFRLCLKKNEDSSLNPNGSFEKESSMIFQLEDSGNNSRLS